MESLTGPNNYTLLSHLRLCSLFVASYDAQGGARQGEWRCDFILDVDYSTNNSKITLKWSSQDIVRDVSGSEYDPIAGSCKHHSDSQTAKKKKKKILD
jgi:hypothetical protein